MVRKEKYLYFYLLLFLLMTLGAFVWQMFFPNVAETFSVWGMSRGWQTEIALWNVGIDVGIMITLVKHNIEYAKILTLISVRPMPVFPCGTCWFAISGENRSSH